MRDKIWTDRKIADLSKHPSRLSQKFGTYVDRIIVTEMRDDYERTLTLRDAEILRLQAELAQAQEELSQKHNTAMWLSADLATLQDALKTIAADIDEMDAQSLGDKTVSLKEVVRLGKVAYKALKATTPEQTEAKPVNHE